MRVKEDGASNTYMAWERSFSTVALVWGSELSFELSAGSGSAWENTLFFNIYLLPLQLQHKTSRLSRGRAPDLNVVAPHSDHLEVPARKKKKNTYQNVFCNIQSTDATWLLMPECREALVRDNP